MNEYIKLDIIEVIQHLQKGRKSKMQTMLYEDE